MIATEAQSHGERAAATKKAREAQKETELHPIYRLIFSFVPFVLFCGSPLCASVPL